MPSGSPTESPTRGPTYIPTDYPTYSPSLNPSTQPSGAPFESLTLYPTQIPTTPSPLALSPFVYIDENESCTSSQIHLRLEIVTDNYPRDSSWQFIDRTDNIILLSSPIDGYSGKGIGSGMMEAQTDIRDICLGNASALRSTRKEYDFVLKDAFGDGLCCRPGVQGGYYKILRKRENANQKWQILVAGSDFDSKEVKHRFSLLHDVGYTNPNSSEGKPGIVQAILGDDSSVAKTVMTSLELICPPPQRKVTVQIMTDKYGGEISWDFRVRGGPIIAKNEKIYRGYELDERDICIQESTLYELTVYDDYEDGMHAFNRKRGLPGYYKILAHRGKSERETILHGGYFQSNKITHLLNTTMPAMDDRDVAWLESHNKRRKYWHPYYNTTYVPLQWSESLKAEAKVWADTLLDSCGDGMHHDPERDYGENAAANVGAGSWGELRVPDKIVARFIDREVGDPWPRNGHLTQALWRASHYVGCADSHKLMDDAGVRQCHTQVCRYARTGNCNMGAYTDETGEIDWLTPTLEEVNYCSDICPNDGCRA